jgi:2-iminoacetate synthase
MNTFKSVLNTTIGMISIKIYATTTKQVEQALKTKRNLDDFLVLISPAAQPYLEQMAQECHELTKKRFGKTIQMFAPCI